MKKRPKLAEKKLLASYSKTIGEFVQGKRYKAATIDQIAAQLAIPEGHKEIFEKAAQVVECQGVIKIVKGVVSRAKEERVVTGIIRVHPRGFGFLKSEEMGKEEVFVPKSYTQSAVDGDTVEVLLAPEADWEKGPEGKVVKILRRGRSHVAGTITQVTKEGGMAYVPLLGNSHEMRITAPSEGHTLKVGDRIIIQVLDWGGPERISKGQMQSYIGHISDASCDITAAVEEFELADAFPHKVINEAQSFGSKVTAKDLEGREDLRELECFTIDPDTARDFDDALSLSRDSKGHFHLGVHIADVSHYVTPGSALDEEARQRCNSTYFPGHVLPMLPHELSSHLCSLKPLVNRLTLSVFVTLDNEGNVLNYRMCRSVIKSQKRFTYKEAKAVLDGKKKSKFAPTLFLMVDLCHRLKRKRYERGSIEFSLPDIDLWVNAQGVPEKVEVVEYDITHQLVEEFMLKANEIVATHLAKERKPLTFRVHQEPDPESFKDFALKCHAFGFKISEAPTAEELQNLFDEVRSTPFAQFVATSFIRSMKLATYSIDNVGHYGLGLEYYTHFTSPIRRYIDLIVHRVLCDEIDADEDLAAIALQCSEKERLSSRAEGSVRQLKKLRLLQEYQKKEPHRPFEAVITAIKPFGFIFEVTELLLEGFFPLSDLQEDYFIYEKNTSQLYGRRQGRKFTAGTKIEVLLRNINLITSEAKWDLVTQNRELKSPRRKR